MIRNLKKSEIKLASDLADSIYPKELEESFETFENKFLFYPAGFLGYFIDGKLIGYIVGHSWKGNDLVPLNYVIKEIKNPDGFYIHDVAISPEYQGRGYGKELMKAIIELAIKEGFRKFLLVAVNEKSKGMIEKFGFKVSNKLEYSPGIIGYKMIKEI